MARVGSRRRPRDGLDAALFEHLALYHCFIRFDGVPGPAQALQGVLVEDAAEELDAVATEGELLGPSSGREQEQEPHHFHEVNSFGCPRFSRRCAGHFTIIDAAC